MCRSIAELPFGPGRRWLSGGGALSAIACGWRVNNILSFYSGTPFNVTAAGTSLNAPESNQRADQPRPSSQAAAARTLSAHFERVTSLSATAAPPRALLKSAASMKAMISSVSSGGIGGTPVWKNFTISTTRLR